jgi:hypothetical protein
MAFRGKFPIRTKILTDNGPTEQLSYFTYLGCDVTYDTNRNIAVKLKKFRHICGTLKGTLKNRTRKETQIKFYRVMAVPPCLYSGETWILNQKDDSSLTAADFAYLNSVRGCTRLDCFHNEDIRQELNVIPIMANIYGYRKCWGEYLLRMDGSQIPKITFKYNPKGRRDVRHPRKRCAL